MTMESTGLGSNQRKSHMIVVRSIVHGVKQHLAIRLSEWVMLLPTFGMFAAFKVQPDMFAQSKSFAHLAYWADENVWALICLMCGVARLGALIVNGTFDSFRYSPHIRMVTSAIGLVVWAQFTLGFLQAYLSINGAFSAVVMYFTPVVLEACNIFRSSRDIGVTYAEVKRRQVQNGVGL